MWRCDHCAELGFEGTCPCGRSTKIDLPEAYRNLHLFAGLARVPFVPYPEDHVQGILELNPQQPVTHFVDLWEPLPEDVPLVHDLPGAVVIARYRAKAYEARFRLVDSVLQATKIRDLEGLRGITEKRGWEPVNGSPLQRWMRGCEVTLDATGKLSTRGEKAQTWRQSAYPALDTQLECCVGKDLSVEEGMDIAERVLRVAARLEGISIEELEVALDALGR